MNMRFWIAFFALLVLLLGFSAAAQQPPSEKGSPPQKKAALPAETLPKERPLSVTHHAITVDNRPLAYTATVGEMIVNKPDEKPGAQIFFIAYTRDDIKELSRRPITFCFNGGPGSSSVWLHLGALGPRRVQMTDDGWPVKPPYSLTDNEYSLLDVTDLVFIDPVSTGYSRPLPGEDKRQFHGIQEDIASVGEFIRLYITKYRRWNSPKFVLGESYGTTRAAGLSGFLQNRSNGMYLNGIVLVSSVLDFQTITFLPGNHLPYILFLPHYAATAWYHKRLPAELQSRPLPEVLAEVESFALDVYSIALLKGNALAKDSHSAVASRLSRYTGLSEEYIRQSNLRIRHDRFVKELLRSDFRTVGRLDSRFLGQDADAAGENYEFDPSQAAIQGSFSSMLNSYVRSELKYENDLPYQIFGNVFPWNFSSVTSPGEPTRRGFGMNVNIAETLRRALAENEALQVFCCNGFYDGATPYFGTVYQFAQVGLNGEFKDRVKMGFYEAGHMMYIHKPSLAKLKADLANFIQDASGK